MQLDRFSLSLAHSHTHTHPSPQHIGYLIMQTGFLSSRLQCTKQNQRTVTLTGERQLSYEFDMPGQRKELRRKKTEETMTEIRATGNVGWIDLMSECQKSENCRSQEWPEGSKKNKGDCYQETTFKCVLFRNLIFKSVLS